MAGHYNSNHATSNLLATSSGSLLMTSSVVILFQSIFQTVFIVNALRRSPLKSYHETKKPGREYVTFLLVVNIAMWAITRSVGQNQLRN